MSKVALLSHAQFLEHRTPPGHPESVARLRSILDGVAANPTLSALPELTPRAASWEELSPLHHPDYLNQLAKTADAPGYLDPDTFCSAHSYEAARLAAGGLIDAVDQTLAGAYDHVFAMVRPPGHHAEADHAMGFCLLNNVALAAEHLVRQGVKRVAIVDFDVHHGNGTQNAFYDRPEVFYLSTHQWPFYPGTGAKSETGRGAGRGLTRNIPLPAGSGDAEYEAAFRDQLIPALRDYRPEFLLVSAGFDAHREDPLASMRVSTEGFVKMVQELEKVAQDYCRGRSVYSLEGGYHLKALQESVTAVLETLIRL